MPGEVKVTKPPSVDRFFAHQLAALPGEAVLRDPDGKPLISLPSPTASEQAPGPVTVAQVYELASAVLYANLERKGKG